MVAVGTSLAKIKGQEAGEVGCRESKHAAGTERPCAFAQHLLPVLPRDVLDDVFAEDEVQRPVVEGERLGDIEVDAVCTLRAQVRGEPAVDVPLAGTELHAPDRVGL